MLEVASILETALLPRLDAKSKFQLAATCRAARYWLFQLPGKAWQQVSHGLQQGLCAVTASNTAKAAITDT